MAKKKENCDDRIRDSNRSDGARRVRRFRRRIVVSFQSAGGVTLAVGLGCGAGVTTESVVGFGCGAGVVCDVLVAPLVGLGWSPVETVGFGWRSTVVGALVLDPALFDGALVGCGPIENVFGRGVGGAPTNSSSASIAPPRTWVGCGDGASSSPPTEWFFHHPWCTFQYHECSSVASSSASALAASSASAPLSSSSLRMPDAASSVTCADGKQTDRGCEWRAMMRRPVPSMLSEYTCFFCENNNQRAAGGCFVASTRETCVAHVPSHTDSVILGAPGMLSSDECFHRMDALAGDIMGPPLRRSRPFHIHKHPTTKQT